MLLKRQLREGTQVQMARWLSTLIATQAYLETYMTYLNLNCKSTKTSSLIRKPITMLRMGAVVVLAIASGVTAQAQPLNLGETPFQHDSADAHKVLSFRFGDKGIDTKSVSFLESQRSYAFRNKSSVVGKEILSFEQTNSDVFLEKGLAPSTSQYDDGSALNSSNYVLSAGLEKYIPRKVGGKLGTATEAPKRMTVASDTSWFTQKDNAQYAKLNTVKPQSGGVIVTAVLP